jgi:transposase InsO family protein
VKRELLELVARTQARTGWAVRRILRQLGIKPARYWDWVQRAVRGALTDQPPRAPALEAVRPEERAAVLEYALGHPKDGYRRLAWQMVDADVAYLSPASVYRVLRDADLLYRWKRSRPGGARPEPPAGPHERWHTDLMYLRIGDTFYFLVTVLDGYSRYVVQWDLLTSMTALDVRRVVEDALVATRAHPQVVTDNGGQFTAGEFRQLVRLFALEHIRIRTYHPESNGVLERFHRSTREALADTDLTNLSRARAIIARWIAHYNSERLHAGLGYLPPAEFYHGDPAARQAERQQKLAAARQRRRAINGRRIQAAA